MAVESNSNKRTKEETTKNILDYFKTPEAANKVLEQIKGLGVNEIQIDRFGRYSLGSAD